MTERVKELRNRGISKGKVYEKGKDKTKSKRKVTEN